MQVKLLEFGSRVKRKIARILSNLIPFNQVYRPTGIYYSSKEYAAASDNEAVYREVYANVATELAISPELYAICSGYMKPLTKVTTTYFVAEIPRGRIHTDNAISVAVITPDNKLLADVSFSYKKGKLAEPEQNSIFRRKYFTRPVRYKGTVFTLLTGGSGAGNYFHWLIDVLPRLHLLKQSGLFEKVDWFLVPACQREFQQQTLQMLGIGKEQIIEATAQAHIETDALLVSLAPRGSYTLIPSWVCKFLQTSFRREISAGNPYPAFIYISRKDTSIRQITNEAALAPVLEKYGFHTYILSQLPFMKQVQLFASAQVVVAPHGAGLINLVFCKKETIVLELFADGYIKPSYADLSAKVGLQHTYLTFKSPAVSTIKKGVKLNMQIEIQVVEAALNRIMSERVGKPKLKLQQPESEICV